MHLFVDYITSKMPQKHDTLKLKSAFNKYEKISLKVYVSGKKTKATDVKAVRFVAIII